MQDLHTLESLEIRIVFMLLTRCSACVGLVLLAASAHAEEPPRRHSPDAFQVAAYLPEWRYEGANWVTICGTVTHLILFSIEVTPTGALAALDRLPRPELMREARAAATASGTKLLLCIGGNGRSAGFSPTVASKKKRARFVAALLELCEKHGFDGVDYNWEYPGYVLGRGYLPEAEVTKDYEGLFKLLEETHAAFAPSGRVITMAYYPDGRQERLLMQGGAPQWLEAMHMMSYDQGERHSTWEFAERVARQGAQLLPAAKVTHGLPFYGRHMRTGDWKSWEDLVQQHRPADGVDEAGGYFFNSAALIERKTRLAKRLGLAGVMIWEVGQDCRLVPVTHGATTHVRTCPADGDADSLLAAVSRGIAAAEDAATAHDEL